MDARNQPARNGRSAEAGTTHSEASQVGLTVLDVDLPRPVARSGHARVLVDRRLGTAANLGCVRAPPIEDARVSMRSRAVGRREAGADNPKSLAPEGRRLKGAIFTQERRARRTLSRD